MAALIGVSVKPKSGGYTCRVPLDSLAEDGVPPEQGDSVSYSVDGTVQSVSDTDATIKVTAVNGQPIDGGGAGAGEESAAGEQPGGGGGPDLASMREKLAAGAANNPMSF